MPLMVIGEELRTFLTFLGNQRKWNGERTGGSCKVMRTELLETICCNGWALIFEGIDGRWREHCSTQTKRELLTPFTIAWESSLSWLGADKGVDFALGGASEKSFIGARSIYVRCGKRRESAPSLMLW